MTPFAFTAWRGLLGAIALLLVVAWRAQRGHHPIDLRSLPMSERWGLVGATLVGLGTNLTLFVAYQRIPIALAVLVFYTYPVLLAVYGRLTGTESFGTGKLVALGLAIAGIVMVVAGRSAPAGTDVFDGLGLVLSCGAALCGAGWVLVGRTYRSVPSDQAMALVLGGIFVGGSIAAIAAGSTAALLLPLDHPGLWPVLAVAGIVAAAISSVLFILGVRLVSPVRVGVLALFEPVVGVATAALVLGQLLDPIQLLGGALIFAAAIVMQRAPERIRRQLAHAPGEAFGDVLAAFDAVGTSEAEAPEAVAPASIA
jgi:drug/metabolite transporter (DMT)-like permease